MENVADNPLNPDPDGHWSSGKHVASSALQGKGEAPGRARGGAGFRAAVWWQCSAGAFHPMRGEADMFAPGCFKPLPYLAGLKYGAHGQFANQPFRRYLRMNRPNMRPGASALNSALNSGNSAKMQRMKNLRCDAIFHLQRRRGYPIWRASDANARASGLGQYPSVYVATVTSLLELSGHEWPGLMEMTMNAIVSAPARAETHIPRDAKLEAYARTTVFDRPTLIIDTDLVREQYRGLKAGLGDAMLHYAVKANPHPKVIETLVAEGCHFDAASRGEIELVLEQGAKPEAVSFGNTIKRGADIKWAFDNGISLFAADSEEELHKLAANAPAAQVYIRLLVGSTEADWPLSRKFGCAPDYALPLMDLAVRLGLRPVGISFHVGSQTRHPEMWRGTLDSVAEVWHAARKAGFMLSLLNIGGGFPAFYGEDIPTPAAYAAGVLAEVAERFGDVPRIMAEPGRGLVAEAGMIAAEVLLVSRKSEADLVRWVYLDIGKFSGLAETMDEAIRYQFITERDDEEQGACILAGPSCDSADVLYEKRMVYLPMGLRAGDKFIIRATGAYTSTYSSVGFNGFPPLDVVAI